MTKTGWWTVNFDITLDGQTISFDSLDDASQQHIVECIREGYRQGEVVMETDDEENEEINEENIREISTPFGTIYIDTWEAAIKNPDNKVRLYDSRKEYLEYMEISTFFYESKNTGLTAEKEYEDTIAVIAACENIDEFLDKFVADVECTATGWDAMAQYMLHNYHEEYNTEAELLGNEYINKIGKYYILID